MFSGRVVEGFEDFAFENCSNAAYLGYPVSSSKETGIL
jgi:hypothetical protein